MIKLSQQRRNEFNDHINHLCEIGDHDTMTTLRMIGLITNNIQSFIQTGFTNSEFTGIQRSLISQFFRDVISDHAATFFEETFDDYVNIFRDDYQNPVDIIQDPFRDVILFTFPLYKGFFKKFRNSTFRKELEKLSGKFLRSAVIDHSCSEDVCDHKLFMNMVLWYLLEKTEPIDINGPGIRELLYMTITGMREHGPRITTEQMITGYFHHINSLYRNNSTLYEFRKNSGTKRNLDYWEKILCRILPACGIWWAKHCVNDYREIKFMNDLNSFREEREMESVKGRICCIFSRDFCNTNSIEDYEISEWIYPDYPEKLDPDKYTTYRRYHILLQDKENFMLHLLTRVGRRDVMMNSFVHGLRNGDIMMFNSCSIVPGNDFCAKRLSEIFDGIIVHKIQVRNENIRVEKR